MFEVGKHQVRVWVERERWAVAVDGARLEHWFETQADAWLAGVEAADRADREEAGRAGVAR